ncbi:MAG: DNA polymerase III subunit delta [Elusimicrobia bacterium]|nr:DNA polymerase III subunit delta [Elusimicrobiota bacterium]
MKEISPKELFSNWSKEKFENVYYFLGEEKTLKEEAVNKLKAIIKPNALDFSKHRLPEADISSILSEANTLSMFSGSTTSNDNSKPRVVILDGLEKLKVTEISEIINYVKDPSPSACLILISDKKPLASDSIAKNSTDGILVNFEKLNDFDAQSLLRSQIENAGASILPEALKIIIEIAGTDAAALKNEADKLIAYHHGKKTPINEADALQSIGFSKEQNPFELSNAIQAKNKDKAIKIIEDFIEEGMEPLRIIYTISSALQKMLRAKILSNSGMPAETIHYAIGVSKGQYYHLNKAIMNFSKNALIKNIDRCLEAEALFKSSRNKNPAITLKQIIYGIMRSK